MTKEEIQMSLYVWCEALYCAKNSKSITVNIISSLSKKRRLKGTMILGTR